MAEFNRGKLKMKDLYYLLRRMKGIELAEKLELLSPNISIWLKSKKIPKKHLDKLKRLRREHDGKREK